MFNTPSYNAGRAQLVRTRLAGKGWTPGMRRATPGVAAMVGALLIGAITHHQAQAVAENLLFWGALASVFIGALGFMLTGDRSARTMAMAKLSSSWAEADARRHAQLQGTTALALLSTLLSADATPAAAEQKSNFSPPSAPGGRSIPHLCLTPRLAQRPRAAA